MGLVALYLKQAYTVPAHFYIHTDWIMFARKVLNFSEDNVSRLRRILRAYYHNFDGLFVLNSDQRDWLCSNDMGFEPGRVKLTAHWVQDDFRPRAVTRQSVLGVSGDTPVMLFAGRISREKGIAELPEIYARVKARVPEVALVVAGSGPAEQELKRELPEAIHLGWVEHQRLPEIYSACDLFLMPSKFDTFGNVVLEAMSCGCPTIAYRTKGPKDIIEDGCNGYVVETTAEMIDRAAAYLSDPARQRALKLAAQKRARDDYSRDNILDQLVRDIGLQPPARKKIRRAA